MERRDNDDDVREIKLNETQSSMRTMSRLSIKSRVKGNELPNLLARDNLSQQATEYIHAVVIDFGRSEGEITACIF